MIGKLRPRSPYDVIAIASLFIALGGTAWGLASGSVGTKQLRSGAVTTPKLRDSDVTRRKLADGAVSAAKIGASAIGTSELANGAVTAEKLAPPPAAIPVRSPPPGFNSNPCDGSRPGEFCNGVATWANYTGGYASASYSMDSSRIVTIQGLVRCFALDNDQDCVDQPGIFVLPPGYRPSGWLAFAVDSGDAAHARVDVLADGTVQWRAGGGAQPGYYLSLSGITFRATH